MRVRILTTALWLTTLTLSVIAADETRTNAIAHRFLAVDDGTLTLHYVDQIEPAKGWRVKFGGYCMDMQLIGSNRVALAVDSGYREFDLADGKEVKVVKGPGGRMHAIERLQDGRTVLGGRDAALWRRHAQARGLGDLPAMVVENDICRDDLLFELELDAIASVDRGGKEPVRLTGRFALPPRT